ALDYSYRREISRAAKDLDPEKDFFFVLSQGLMGNSDYNSRSCYAREMINAGVDQTFQDLMEILEKGNLMSWKELRYKILVPESCRQEGVYFPDYDIDTFPGPGETRSFESVRNRIYQALVKGYPTEISFCSSKK